MLKTFSMSDLIRTLTLSLTVFFMSYGCGKKGDPVPYIRARPAACIAKWNSHRVLDVTLPSRDEYGHDLVSIDKIRIYYLALGNDRPVGDTVITKGLVIMEQSRPDVTNLRDSIKLDLRQMNYPPGWLTVAAVRVGGVVGLPSETLVWLDSSS